MQNLIDVSDLSDQQCDCALESIHKAITDSGDDDAIWAQMDSPFLRRLVDLFTQRGLMRLDGFRKELVEWIDGQKHIGGDRLPMPAGMMERWSPAELNLVKLYLERLPTEEFALDDWMMVVDYLMQRYLPAAEMRTEAEWLAVRSTLMGRVQANMESLSLKQADKVLAELPLTTSAAAIEFNMRPTPRAVLDYAAAHAVENVQKLTDDVRHRMRSLLLRHHEQKLIGLFSAPGTSVQSDLLDQFGTLNRDWRRIAVTEAVENSNQAYIAMLKPGTKVKRLEHYNGACAFCRKIDGMVFEVVDPSTPEKDPWTQVWVGKTNVGRSASPRKRVGGVWVERDPSELWVPAAGAQHPYCRGSWLPEIQDQDGDDSAFGDWLRATLSPKKSEASA